MPFLLPIQIRDKGINDDRCLLGWVSTIYGADWCSKVDNEKNAVYNNSNIFVFPTYYDRECFPLSILEAMSFGLPIISTNEGAISEIVDDNINGFIVDKRDIQQLVDRILFLYNNRDKLNDFGNSSLEKFKNNYSLEIFENNFKNIVDKVME